MTATSDAAGPEADRQDKADPQTMPDIPGDDPSDNGDQQADRRPRGPNTDT